MGESSHIDHVKHDSNIECFRVICMLGVVGIHAFSWTGSISHGAWALCCPSLVGFVMISAWFGLHFRVIKLIRLLGTTTFCVLIVEFVSGGDGVLRRFAGYWYLWAYVFLMLWSPVIDAFVERCSERYTQIVAFTSISFMLWGWCFIAAVVPNVPTVAGFCDNSGLVVLCIYLQMRLMKKLGWIDALKERRLLVMVGLWVSGLFVFLGFRHMHGIFAFAFALCSLICVQSISLSERVGRFFCFLGPSMFSVYLLHFPFKGMFPLLWNYIHDFTHFSNVVCQLLVAIVVFSAAIVLDMPRRFCVFLINNLKITQLKK